LAATEALAIEAGVVGAAGVGVVGVVGAGRFVDDVASGLAAPTGILGKGTSGAANSVNGARLRMQLAAEEAAGARAPTSISSYSDHAIKQIAGRDGGKGVDQAAIDSAFLNPKAIQYVPSNYGPTFRYVGENATVAVNPQGHVTTAWGTSAAGLRR